MYYVEVLSISMEGKKLPIDPVEFQLRSDFKGGFAIDTGSALTYLVQNAYNIVRVEIVKYLQAYNWNPTVHSELPYDLCYDVIPIENQQFPSLTIHFLGANLDQLGSHRVFKLFYDDTFCMFILPTSQQGTNILGAFQQADYQFLFDVGTG
ncbi:aspartic proteinase nepenthesin-1-like [Quercus lobata]|nr:aspartic proteinase nepenthesin-1-like [Quercus lobata]